MIRDVFYYGKKPNVHPREKPAKDLIDARNQATTEHFWIVDASCDYRNFDWDFDFDLLPDEDVWAVDHNNIWPSQHQKDSGTWLCPKAHSDIKIYRNDVDIVTRKNIKSDHWILLDNIDESKFDFSWHPDPSSPPFIYKWGCKHFPPQLNCVLEYRVPGATATKFMKDVVELAVSPHFKEIQKVKENSWIKTWRPDPREPAYIYVWGNKYVPGEIKSTIEYHTPGATAKKYMGNVDVLPEWEKFKILIPVDKTKFDFSWRPDPREPAYIYVWGNQHNSAEEEPTIEYHCPEATERKYMHDQTATTLSIAENWKQLIPVENFDFTWRPNPHDPPYIYVFGNQWHDVTLEPTLEYHAPGATEKKYITDIVAHTKPDMKNWNTNYQIENFDYSWRPHPHDPPMIYQFGTLLDDIHLKDGPIYSAPNNNGTIVYLDNNIASKSRIVYPKYFIKTTLDELILEHPNEIFWAIRETINYTNFNFDWVPTKENVFHINVFGSAESELTQTYFVNSSMINQGFGQKNYIDDVKLDSDYLAALFKPIDMFYVDKGNVETNHRFEKLKERYPNIQKTRYLNNWVDTINRCLNKCTTELAWILNSELDYSEFDFQFYPNPWQMKMVHVFGTQWSHWGTTFVVNSETFPEETKYIKIIEHLQNINFVRKSKAIATNCLYEVYLIDHGNSDTENIYNLLRNKLNSDNVYTIPYNKGYLQTFRNLLEEIPIRKDHYIWVCSSVCDYNYFDFSYVCDPFTKDHLHVFASNEQKYGDTFLIDVNKLRTLITDMTLLDNYEKINFNNQQKVSRLKCPLVISNNDTHTDLVSKDFDFPYALVKTEDNVDLNINLNEPPILWSDSTKTINILSEGATNIFVPKEIKKYVVNELYDYPYILKSKSLLKSNPLDIVFLSNGEINADENYEHLLKVTKGLSNRVVRVDGVNGRVAAYHAAAEASKTPWMFTVFAKLKVNENFDWDWQPDRLQIPKHYIFYASNPVTGLEYGHQAMIVYNKKLTLSNTGIGLDFTMDSDHEVVQVNSGTAIFNTDAWSTWRTAFREAIKLSCNTDNVSKYRLLRWTTKATGDFAEYSLKGANHAVQYYEEVNGDLDKLKLSYEWDWLKERYKHDNT